MDQLNIRFSEHIDTQIDGHACVSWVIKVIIFFFLTPFPVYCEEYTINGCWAFRRASDTYHALYGLPLSCPLTISFLIGWITSHIMLLPWGPRCLGSASFAPWRPRQHRHLRGLAPSPSKDHCPGAGYIIFTPRKERLRMGYTVGLYFPRLAGVSWNPLAHVVQDLAGFVASHLGIKQAQYG